MINSTLVQFNAQTIAKMAGCVLLMLGAAVHAEDSGQTATAASQKADPVGTWIWSVPGRKNGPELTNVLVMKVEGQALTGQVISPGRTGDTNVLALQNGKVDGDNISFVISKKFPDFSMTADYSGKVDGDTITGKIAVERLGRVRTNQWTAIRQSHKTDMIAEAPAAAEKK